MCFWSTAAFKGIFVLKILFKKNNNKNGQVLNKPQIRLLLKFSGGTFYQIQTENSTLSQIIDSKPLTDRIYVTEYSIFVTKT